MSIKDLERFVDYIRIDLKYRLFSSPVYRLSEYRLKSHIGATLIIRRQDGQPGNSSTPNPITTGVAVQALNLLQGQ